MTSVRYTFSLLFLCLLLATAKNAHAQCTSDAGSLGFLQGTTCENDPLHFTHNGNQVLDGDDILLFVAYTGDVPNAGNVFATSTDESFAYQSDFLANSPFKIAAVAGNNLGGTMDWNDPCLSVSNALEVTYMPPPTISVTVSGTLTCLTPTVTITTSSNQPNVTYLWTNGFVGPNPPISQPGLYCVTVTNQAGCSVTECVAVVQDVILPISDAGSPQLLTCTNGQVTLTGGNSSTGPNFTYQWAGPGITPANANLLNPVVILPGTYTLVVTNTSNGCTSSSFVTVMSDNAIPFISAGPDTGIPCGGGTVTLNTTAQPPGQIVFSWAGPNNFTSTQQNPVVSGPGVYTCVATLVSNGCTATDEVTVFPGPAIPQQDFEVTNAACAGINNGSIVVNITVGQPPFTYSWTGPNGFSANSKDINNLAAGTYHLVAEDATGCDHYANVAVGHTSLIVVSPDIQQPTCSANGQISLNISGGVPPYTVQWNINGTPGPVGPIIQVPPVSSVISTTVTDANGCTAIVPPIIIQQPPSITSVVNELSNTCEEAVIQAQAFGGTPPYTYSWSGPNNFVSAQPTIVVPAGNSGPYTVTIVDANGCSSIIFYIVQTTGGDCGNLSGHVIRDVSENCLADSGESGLAGWLVRAEGTSDTIYGVTNSVGKYVIGVPLGNYVVTAIPANNLWELCPVGTVVNVNVTGDTFPVDDILVKKVFDCPALTVSIGTNLLRRCFSTNYYFVSYCNQGTATAEDAYILITLDPFLLPVGASLPYTDLGNNILRFDLGEINVGECGSFSLQVKVSCDAVLGQTHCTEAHIYPDSTCLPFDPFWSGASLQVSSQCDADSVRFVIENIGNGNMGGPVDYVVVEDAVMFMSGVLPPLSAGASMTLAFPANGSTWRLEVEQEPFHPGNSQPALSVEGCSPTTVFSTGFVTQFPNNEADPWIDIDCTQNIGAYDPNDKQGFPNGYGPMHYIRPGTEIEYLIRFQNTGTDTAFTVRIVDTLSAWLDPATIRPGASSHAYQFNLTGPGIVEFLYENILLPDSNVNEPASNGFVKFNILHRADAPLETVLENRAAIYFDFNEPVITNRTYHRLGENFIVRAWQPYMPGATITVAPNPLGDWANLEVKGLHSSAPLRLRVYDSQGAMVHEMESPSPVFTLRRGNWLPGVYLFSVEQGGQWVGSGKLVVR